MSPNDELPKLYTELADWWTLLSAPEDYAEEAQFYRQAILNACQTRPRTLLELGSGGGNNASHLKQYFEITLVDRAPGMLAVSQRLNPECEHILGDMRSVHLGRQFDAVFIHDAIVYMSTAADLLAALRSAYEHCRPGGVALFAPDHTRETFQPSTEHGGHDYAKRGLRYLECTWPISPGQEHYISYMVYLLRDATGDVTTVLDQHHCGLFSQADWLRFIAEAGFSPQMLPFEHSEIPAGTMHVFLGHKGI